SASATTPSSAKAAAAGGPQPIVDSMTAAAAPSPSSFLTRVPNAAAAPRRDAAPEAPRRPSSRLSPHRPRRRLGEGPAPTEGPRHPQDARAARDGPTPSGAPA